VAGLDQAGKAGQEAVPPGRYFLGGQAEVAEGEDASVWPGVVELKLDGGFRPARSTAVLETGPPHTRWAGHLVHAHDDRLVHVLKAEGQLAAGPRRPDNDRRPPTAQATDRGYRCKDSLRRRPTGHRAHVTVNGDAFARLAHRATLLRNRVQAQDYTSYGLWQPFEGGYARLVSAEAALAALAEPRRRAMLLLVRDQPRSVGEIAAHFQITQQAVSQHLKVLRDAGLVDVRADRQRRLYLVRPEGLRSVEAFLAELWPASLQCLKSAVESGDAG